MSKYSELLLLLLLVLPVSCQLCVGDEPSLESSGSSAQSADLGQMHSASDNCAVWIGGYPTPKDLDLAQRRGVKAAIDLSTPGEAPGYDVARACRKLGIEYVSMGVQNKVSIADARVDRVLAGLRRWAREPLLLFCGDGSRAAMLFAIHRAVDDSLPIDQALVEARWAGMKPGRPELFVRGQVVRLLSHS
jgi:protein tyrosine phosphatase (PTP) superfamily phosphohydrolase (DUF442 family)